MATCSRPISASSSARSFPAMPLWPLTQRIKTFSSGISSRDSSIPSTARRWQAPGYPKLASLSSLDLNLFKENNGDETIELGRNDFIRVARTEFGTEAPETVFSLRQVAQTVTSIGKKGGDVSKVWKVANP